MKYSLFVIVLALLGNSWAQDEALMQDAITKPAFSIRCKELFKERSDKIKMQHKLNALLQRNIDLIKKTPNTKEAMHARLKSNQIKIENELNFTNSQVHSMEENIVRSGCPGLSL